MLIPSIDLMGGKIVQLVQGEKKALEFDDFDQWIARFSRFPLVQLIDLDAAIGSGNNRALLSRFTSRLACQVGGGIRSLDAASEALAIGAKRIILGSVLIRNNEIDRDVAKQFADRFSPDCLTFGVDSKGGQVAIRGWRAITSITPDAMMQALEPYCAAFLYTHIDTEGLMEGIPLETVKGLRATTSRQLIVAGGISSQEEVDQLDRMGMDAVVGMAIYTGKLRLDPKPA
ncbi:MAG TPA: 1-(5-phosphoribosyl)-5-[(5-phosphoribosylamino)methylideneamino] imidazole-4-carboxamide isomerase [Terriglobales bacterium]|nr:1-(5-phosphoribosyl)-5-[(5-phosphoribosylamino)methylideneamino] imidazole-4-carboxamide isomerase [Terriglobales bacterium]